MEEQVITWLSRRAMKEKIKTELRMKRERQDAHKRSCRKCPRSCHTSGAPQNPSFQDSLSLATTGASRTKHWQVGITLAADGLYSDP